MQAIMDIISILVVALVFVYMLWIAAYAPIIGTRSTEILHHFQCNKCKGWWTIGDAPEREQWWCPWCGNLCNFDK